MNDNLKVVEQKEVEFYEDHVIALRLSDGTVYVPVRPLIERLGLAWGSQRNRLHRDPVLSDSLMSVVVTNTDITPGSRRPQTSEMLCLPLDYISGFLFGINADRVKSELRDWVIRYQKECHRVLGKAFQEGRLTNSISFDDLLTQDMPAVHAYKLAQAVMQMAQQQLLHEARLGEHESRLEALEAQISSPSRTISTAQASQISQAVKAIAMEMTKRSGRNEYGGVYGELYRRFEITGYKELSASRFEEALAFLTDWHQTLVDSTPF